MSEKIWVNVCAGFVRFSIFICSFKKIKNGNQSPFLLMGQPVTSHWWCQNTSYWSFNWPDISVYHSLILMYLFKFFLWKIIRLTKTSSSLQFFPSLIQSRVYPVIYSSFSSFSSFHPLLWINECSTCSLFPFSIICSFNIQLHLKHNYCFFSPSGYCFWDALLLTSVAFYAGASKGGCGLLTPPPSGHVYKPGSTPFSCFHCEKAQSRSLASSIITFLSLIFPLWFLSVPNPLIRAQSTLKANPEP